MADVKKIQLQLVEKSEEMAKLLKSGKDIMITTGPNGVVIKKLEVQRV